MARYAMIVTLALAALAAPGAAQAKNGSVVVQTEPVGARITLGRRSWQAPKTLWLRINQTYQLKLSAPGHQDKTESVTLTQRRTTLRFKLDPLRVKVTVVAGDDDAIGGTLRINGEVMGTVPTTVEVPPGRIQLEVTKSGHATWSQWLNATADQKSTVTVTLAKTVGDLHVRATPDGARVLVDGSDRGNAPLKLSDLPAGSHVVEVQAKGHAPQTKVVEIIGGQTARLALDLKPVTKAPKGGTLHVLTEPEQVDVYLDGSFRGKSPLKLLEQAEGSHILSVRWPGFRTVERDVAISGGRLTAVKVKLTRATPAPEEAAATGPKESGHLLVASSVRGASVYLDGALVGQTPFVRSDLAVGTYKVKVASSGYEPVVETVRVDAGRTVRVGAILESQGGGTEAAVQGDGTEAGGVAAPDGDGGAGAPAVDPTSLSAFGAQLIPPRSFTADLGFGFPYIFEGRLVTGVFTRRHLALDAGVAFRTNGAFNEAALSGRFRLLRYDPFAVAVLAEFGAGGGPGSRDTFYFNAGASASLLFRNIATFTASFYGNFYSDRLCPESPEAGEPDACVFPPRDLSFSEVRDRFGGARFYLNAAIDVSLSARISVFAEVEGTPFQAERWAFTDRFVALMPAEDTRLYGRAGLTFKF